MVIVLDSLPDGSLRKNVFIFGVDMSPSVHIDNKNKDMLNLSEGPTQGWDTAQKMKFSVMDFFSKCGPIAEEIHNIKLYFLFNEMIMH